MEFISFFINKIIHHVRVEFQIACIDIRQITIGDLIIAFLIQAYFSLNIFSNAATLVSLIFFTCLLVIISRLDLSSSSSSNTVYHGIQLVVVQFFVSFIHFALVYFFYAERLPVVLQATSTHCICFCSRIILSGSSSHLAVA